MAGELNFPIILGVVLVGEAAEVVVVVVEKGVVVLVVQIWSAMSVGKLDTLLVNVDRVAAAEVVVVADAAAAVAVLQDIGEVQAMGEGEFHLNIQLVLLVCICILWFCINLYCDWILLNMLLFLEVDGYSWMQW